MGTAGLNALKSVGLRGVVFQETEFSPDNTSADGDFERLTEKFYATRENATELVDMGLSPHSPYTVSRELFEKIARFALDEDIQLSVHAAESTDEDALVRDGIGFFNDIYRKFGVEWEVPGRSPVEFLSRTGVLDTRPLLVHCVAVTDSDVRLMAESGSRIAHCPKSNAKFGHGVAPFESFLDAGIAVGLGSDSVASNNVCDLLEEARFAALAARNRAGSKRFISAAEMLEAATLGGARSLGLDHKIGTLEAGKAADITAVSLGAMAQQPDNDVCSTLVFASNARDVVMTMVAGEEIYRDGVMKNLDEAETVAALQRIKGQEH
jgi:5-methylthioadenosine/S-adenosylhomocysteine deaminase